MEKTTNELKKKCPSCEREDGQQKNGRNRSGTQTCICKHCKKTYTLEPKRHAHSEETVAFALKIYYAGTSGRGVGKILGINKGSVYNWIKKNSTDCG